MIKGQLLAGIDVGSSQVVCVLGRVSEETGKLEIIAGSKIPSKGLKGGVVINIQEASYAIGKAVELVEEQAKEPTDQICIALRGNHLESLNAHGTINISRSDKEITQEDVYNVIETAKAIRMSQDREILDSVAQEYALNHQKGVPNPVGMEGNFLEADVHVITASSSHLNNVDKSIAQAGFRDMLSQVYGLLAVGNCVVSQEEKELGCLLIDFGGLTTGIAIYSEGSIRFSKELQIGSDFITRDISHGLRTSMVSAKEIKEKYGYAMASLIDEDKTFNYQAVDGRTMKEYSSSKLVDIIQPRLDQMFVLIEDEIKKSNYADVIIPAEVIITGGGARLNGMVNAVEQALNCSARIGLPQNIDGNEQILNDPSYATAIGLLSAEVTNDEDVSYIRNIKRQSGFAKFKSWFDRTF
ncbi:cell division protein FtsA [Elusimicrobiota bacterium]